MASRAALTGSSLTIADVVAVARQGRTVELDDTAMDRCLQARQLLLELANEGIPIYGVNTGLGGNKEKKVAPEFFKAYNREIILSHCAAVQPEAGEDEVRAAMLVRLNILLRGCTGIQPSVIRMYAAFLNAGIHPVVPKRGSIGAADITSLSHIGLAMIGEGSVNYKGKRVPASEALAQVGLKPVELGPKDGLAIISSNAYAAGLAALVLHDLRRAVAVGELVTALSLEALGGNVSPLDEAVNRARPFEGQQCSAAAMRGHLRGSYLHQPTDGAKAALQDPLSFRCAAHIYGAARDAIATAEKALQVQLNSDDNNPCLLLAERRVVSCGNFEALSWVLPFEALGLAIAHLSRTACHRVTKLCDPRFTSLTAFLAPTATDNIMGYGILEISATALDAEVRHLSNPVSTDFVSVSLGMEDHACCGPYVVERTARALNCLQRIMGMELLLAAQAVDLRKVQQRLGEGTTAAYTALRLTVPFLKEPRDLSVDIEAAFDLVRSDRIILPAPRAKEEAVHSG